MLVKRTNGNLTENGIEPTLFAAFVAACFLFLPGCSKLKLEKVRTITLNRTTDGAIKEMFGVPHATGRHSGSSGVSTKKYFYCETQRGELGSADWPERWIDYTSLVVETRDGFVTGYVFVCNYLYDAPRFDASSLDRISVGQSREQVIAALGAPYGMALSGTSIPDLKNFDGPDIAELLVWMDAPQDRSIVPSDYSRLHLFIVQLAADGRVCGKGEHSVTIRLQCD